MDRRPSSAKGRDVSNEDAQEDTQGQAVEAVVSDVRMPRIATSAGGACRSSSTAASSSESGLKRWAWISGPRRISTPRTWRPEQVAREIDALAKRVVGAGDRETLVIFVALAS